MASTITVRVPDGLQQFIKSQTDGHGIYDSTSEYLRDLIRRDYERVEELKWQKLEGLLQPGLEADEAEFKAVSREEFMAIAKAAKYGA